MEESIYIIWMNSILCIFLCKIALHDDDDAGSRSRTRGHFSPAHQSTPPLEFMLPEPCEAPQGVNSKPTSLRAAPSHTSALQSKSSEKRRMGMRKVKLAKLLPFLSIFLVVVVSSFSSSSTVVSPSVSSFLISHFLINRFKTK